MNSTCWTLGCEINWIEQTITRIEMPARAATGEYALTELLATKKRFKNRKEFLDGYEAALAWSTWTTAQKKELLIHVSL